MSISDNVVDFRQAQSEKNGKITAVYLEQEICAPGKPPHLIRSLGISWNEEWKRVSFWITDEHFDEDGKKKTRRTNDFEVRKPDELTSIIEFFAKAKAATNEVRS